MDGDLGVRLEVDTRAPRGTGRDAASPESLSQLAASMVPPSPPAWRRALAQLLHLWLLVLFVVVWELASVLGERLNPQLSIMLPPPTAVFSAAQDLIARGVLLTHVADSLRRVLVAVGAAAALGAPLGLAMGWSVAFRRAMDPLVAGELVAAPTGLGYMINNARTLFRSDYILLGMVLIGLLGLVLDFLMRQVARLAMPWYQGG